MRVRSARCATFLALVVLLAGCTPSAPNSPTAAAKPTAGTTAATVAPVAKPAESPAAQPSAGASPSVAASPVASPAVAAPTVSAAATSFDEQAVASFYRGKTMKVVVGYAAGGGNDLASRMLARYLPKYIPGNPTVIVENKPGAATMLAMNTVYNIEPKDGTVIANFNPQLLLSQAIGSEGLQFDATKVNWLGAASNEPVLCAVRSDRGVNSIQDVMGPNGKEIVFPTTGPGSPPHDTPAVLNAVLGTKFKLVAGYAGSADQNLAVENGEADGKCGILDTGTLDWLDRGFAKVLIIMGDKTPDNPHLAGVPAAETLAKNADDLELLKAVNAPSRILRSFYAPPDVPADRVAALRRAVAMVFQDPEFQAEATAAKFSLAPATGDQVGQIVQQVLNTPPAQTARLKQVLAPQ